MKNKERLPYSSIFSLRLLIFFTFVLFCTIELPSLGFATTYYLATNGNDAYNGHYPSYQGGYDGPFRTLGKAASTVTAGDIVQIRGGTYHESVTFSHNGTASNRISITNYSGESVTIDGEYTIPGMGTGLVTISGDYVTFSNVTIIRSKWGTLTMDGEYSYGINIVGNGSRESGFVLSGDHELLDGCSMTDNGNGYNPPTQETWGSAIAAMKTSSNCTIQNCISYNNRGEGIGSYGHNGIIQDCLSYDNAAIELYIGGYGNIVRRNLLYCSAGAWCSPIYGIMIGGETQGESVDLTIINNLCLGNFVNLASDSNVTSADGWLIAYNTFVNSQKTASQVANGYNMGVYFRSGLVTFTNSMFKNNIILEEQGDLIPITLPSSHAGFTFSNNCWNKTPQTAAQGTGDIIGNPKLAKTGSTGAGLLTAAWFKILEGSPARHRAQVLGEVMEDFFKSPRGKPPDMGAIEFSYGTSSLIASATSSPTTGHAPLVVNFTGSAGGGTSPYSHAWTFGDGGLMHIPKSISHLLIFGKLYGNPHRQR
jgi:hypothetical protein